MSQSHFNEFFVEVNANPISRISSNSSQSPNLPGMVVDSDSDSDGGSPAMSPPITPGHVINYLAGEARETLSEEQKNNIAVLLLLMIEALDFLNEQYPVKPAALVNMIETKENKHACYLHVMSRLSPQFKSYLNSYILVGEKLYYIDSTCRCKNVEITNFATFSTLLHSFNPDNLAKIPLSEKQVSSLITSTRGHTYHTNLRGTEGRATLEALLVIARAYAAKNKKHAGFFFGPMRSDLFYRVCKVVAELSLTEVSSQTACNLYNDFTKIDPGLTSQRTELLGLKRQWKLNCGRFTCLYTFPVR